MERVNYIIDNNVYTGYCVNIPGLVVQANSFEEMQLSMHEIFSAFIKDKLNLLNSDDPFTFVNVPNPF